METKEPQKQNKKDNISILSLFSSNSLPNIHQRRIKSDPKHLTKEISFQNTLNDSFHEYNPEIKPKETENKILLNTNSYGFKGRSPYVSSSNVNIKNINNISLNRTQNDIFDFDSIENDNDNSNQRIINGFIFTELKDKVFEYRCSVCNFVTHSNNELYKHLAENNHFIVPKKHKKNKAKAFHKQENNRLNQTFMFSINKPKKYSDKKIICKHCFKRFESNYALNSHLNAHKYKCDICYKLFNNKEDLMEHKHIVEERENEINSPVKKKRNKFFKEKFKMEKNKIEIDDWEEASSSKKENKKESKKNEFGESYAFIEGNDENIDFNRMIKINDGF